jgi:subtilisin family serine protease
MSTHRFTVDPLRLIRLSHLMSRTSGTPEVRIGLIDGAVDTSNAALVDKRVMSLAPEAATTSIASRHATYIACLLLSSRAAQAPGLCPDCTLISRPLFDQMASPDADELARAIVDCIDAGARIINLSLSVRPCIATHAGLRDALDHAMRQGVIAVAAAGNESSLSSSSVTRHAWTLPVSACDANGRQSTESNLGRSIGSHGVMAPGFALDESFTTPFRGTSIAAAFTTGVVALLWSLFPSATAHAVRAALRPFGPAMQIVPPLLDAAASLSALADSFPERRRA